MNEKWLSILVLIMQCKITSSYGSNLLKDRSKHSLVGEECDFGRLGGGGERRNSAEGEKKNRRVFVLFCFFLSWWLLLEVPFQE